MSASQFILHIDDTRCISGIFKETRKFKITTNKCLIIEIYYMSGIYTEPGITWTSDVLYCWNCWKKNHWRKTALGSALVCVRGAPLCLTPGSQGVKIRLDHLLITGVRKKLRTSLNVIYQMKEDRIKACSQKHRNKLQIYMLKDFKITDEKKKI